ncbi:MAG: alkaline phosphatase family protein [bacterium]
MTRFRLRFYCFLCFLALVSGGCSDRSARKVLVLGLDGMPYAKVKEMMEAGKLPHFAELARQGGFQALGSSIPPQSPVAWSSFITGKNPGKTNIYDFIARKPESYIPYLSTSSIEGETEGVTIGNLVLPLKSPKAVLLRRGRPFWRYLEDKGVSTVVIKVPANYPPAKTSGRSLAGMGTPDILGTYGTFTFFTTRPQKKTKDTGGIVVKVAQRDHHIKTRLTGPANPFSVKHEKLELELNIYLDPENPVARIDAGDQTRILLKKGQWSGWTRLSFEMTPYLPSSSGTLSTVCKFFLKSVHPYFELYVTPLNIDPAHPSLPVSTPENYVEELADRFGPFYTQGMPEDTWALNEGRLSDEQFLQQVRFVQEEKRKIFFYEFDRFKSGFLFCHFFATDQLAHMFWRYIDPRHPGYRKDKRFENIIENSYIEMDEILGKVMKRIDKNTTLMVISDHGFASFRRFFHLNTWLYRNGYIKLLDETRKESGEFFENVDWSRTRAYALGLNSLYLNLRGREGQGIVEPGKEAEALKKEIIDKLKRVTDAKNSGRVIKEVYDAERIYSGQYVKTAPDLIVGYNRNYRTSWETALGKIPDALLGDNMKAWSGDHCMAVDLVPGIVLTNRKITLDHPSLVDLAPTVLSEFGIPEPGDMDGQPLFK